MVFRPYSPDDRQECLAVYDSNVPEYFTVDGRPEYESFLGRLPGPYFVIEQSGAIVACGGFAADSSDPGVTVPCWGMVACGHHRSGLSRMLLTERLKRHTGRAVRLNSSPLTRAFYERFGFGMLRIVPSGYGPGLDLHEMWML